MKEFITTICVVLFSVTVQGQDFKVKKGIVSIDKKDVAKINKTAGVYQFTSLDEKTTFWAELQRSQNNTLWLQLKGDNDNLQDMEIKDVPFTISYEKYTIMAVYFSAEGLLTSSGIDHQRAKELFQSSNTEISDKWNKIDADNKATIEAEASLLTKARIEVTDKGNIMQGNQKMGSIQTTKGPTAHTSFQAVIFDDKGNAIAKVNYDEPKAKNDEKGVVLTTFDGKIFDIPDLNYFGQKAEPIRANVIFVGKLYANGYQFGDMTQQIQDAKFERAKEKQDQFDEFVEQLKDNSLNIYDQQGYVIDKKGNKHEGLVSIEFESIEQKVVSGIADLSSYGTTVTLKVDKKKTSYKVKDGVEFGFDNLRFIGTPTSEDGGLNNSNGELDLFGGSSKFLVVDYDNGGNMVLHHLRTPDAFYLILKGQKKAIYLGNRKILGTRKEEAIEKLFDKYVNCGALEFSNYDTNTFEGLKQLVDDYVSSCN